MGGKGNEGGQSFARFSKFLARRRFVMLRRSRRAVLTCLSRRTGVQVGAIFDVRALLTPPLAAERMAGSPREWVFVQKCLRTKRSYLTEKGLFRAKAAGE